MPLDHFSLLVPAPKIDDMVTFLTSSLKHLGFKVYMRPTPSVVGMGDGVPYLWITALGPKDGDDEKIQESLLKRQHIAFTADSQPLPSLGSPFVPALWLSFFFAIFFVPTLCFSILMLPLDPPDIYAYTDIDQVQQFYAAALKAGGTCNGPPGPRPQYHPGYYGAFVLDPVCGVNFEVVCHNAGGGVESEGKH